MNTYHRLKQPHTRKRPIGVVFCLPGLLASTFMMHDNALSMLIICVTAYLHFFYALFNILLNNLDDCLITIKVILISRTLKTKARNKREDRIARREKDEGGILIMGSYFDELCLRESVLLRDANTK